MLRVFCSALIAYSGRLTELYELNAINLYIFSGKSKLRAETQSPKWPLYSHLCQDLPNADTLIE